MKFTTSTTLAALLVATLGLGATASAASAQDRSGARPDAPRHHQMMMRHHGDHRPGGRRLMESRRAGGILALTCNPAGGDRLEHSLLSLSQRVDPTATQQPLFEAFSDAAIEAQAGYAEACAMARTAAGSEARPNLVERLESRIELGSARTEAMSAVLPALQAFHDSLSEEQKAALEPRRGKGSRHLRLRGERTMPNAPVAPRLDG